MERIRGKGRAMTGDMMKIKMGLRGRRIEPGGCEKRGRREKKKSDQLDANEMPTVSARDIWGGLTRRALLWYLSAFLVSCVAVCT